MVVPSRASWTAAPSCRGISSGSTGSTDCPVAAGVPTEAHATYRTVNGEQADSTNESGGPRNTRGPRDAPGVNRQRLRGVARQRENRIEPAAVAAIVIEPVLGEGGFYTASYAFFRALRDICDRHGILLIVDEVQSGFARTGRLFAMDWVR